MPFLLASPGGLIDGDRLVEINCLMTAKDLTHEKRIPTKIIISCEIVNGKFRLNQRIRFIIRYKVNFIFQIENIVIFVFGHHEVCYTKKLKDN